MSEEYDRDRALTVGVICKWRYRSQGLRVPDAPSDPTLRRSRLFLRIENSQDDRQWEDKAVEAAEEGGSKLETTKSVARSVPETPREAGSQSGWLRETMQTAPTGRKRGRRSPPQQGRAGYTDQRKPGRKEKGAIGGWGSPAAYPLQAVLAETGGNQVLCPRIKGCRRNPSSC